MSLFRLLSPLVLLCLFVATTGMVLAEDVVKPARYKPSEPVLAMFKEACKKWKSKDFVGGERDMSAVIEKDPKFAGAYYRRAGYRHMLHDYNGALSDCNQSIALEPNGNPIFYFDRAMTEYRLKMLDECIHDCNISLKRAPKFPGPYLYRALAKQDKGDKKGALLDCDAYLQANPTNARALMLKTQLMLGG